MAESHNRDGFDWVDKEVSGHLEIKAREISARASSDPFLWEVIMFLVTKVAHEQGGCPMDLGPGILLEAETLAYNSIKEFGELDT